MIPDPILLKLLRKAKQMHSYQVCVYVTCSLAQSLYSYWVGASTEVEAAADLSVTLSKGVSFWEWNGKHCSIPVSLPGTRLLLAFTAVLFLLLCVVSLFLLWLLLLTLFLKITLNFFNILVADLNISLKHNVGRRDVPSEKGMCKQLAIIWQGKCQLLALH